MPRERGIDASFLEKVWPIFSAVGRSIKDALAVRWCDRTPFLVRLRDFSDGKLPKPEALPGLIAAEAPGTAEAWVWKTLKEERALVLLDGIDEVPGENRESLARSIGNYLTFLEQYNTQLVVTSRPAAVQDPVWRELFGPVRASVGEMSPGDVEQFIEHWHCALALATHTTMDTEMVDRLIGKVRDRPALTPLAETPLLCAAICYLHRIRRGEIPDHADKLYAQVCEQLVHRLDEHRLKKEGLDRLVPALRGLDADKKMGLLARLAEFMVAERATILDLPRARLHVETGLREINALDGRDPNAVLDALQERSGVLRGWSQDEVEFAHNRLRSYLAARAFKDEEALRQPIEGALATADPDLPVLAAAMGSIRYRERLIGELLKKADAGAEHPRVLQIMALRCGATGQLSDDFRERLGALERAVLPPSDPEEAAQLAELGPRIAQQLAFATGREPVVDAACVRTLRLIGGAEVVSVVEGYLSHENEEVLDELAQAVNPLRIPSVLAFVTSRETFKKSWESCKPLRNLREDDLTVFDRPETVQLLNLKGTRLSDAGAVLKFKRLQSLSLSGTQVGDLAPLQGLSALQSLDLSNTQVSKEDPMLQELQERGVNVIL